MAACTGCSNVAFHAAFEIEAQGRAQGAGLQALQGGWGQRAAALAGCRIHSKLLHYVNSKLLHYVNSKLLHFVNSKLSSSVCAFRVLPPASSGSYDVAAKRAVTAPACATTIRAQIKRNEEQFCLFAEHGPRFLSIRPHAGRHFRFHPELCRGSPASFRFWCCAKFRFLKAATSPECISSSRSGGIRRLLFCDACARCILRPICSAAFP
jgi:hypothetical protein